MPDKKKILVIDDDKAIHLAMKAILESAGYGVFSALDAMQGPMMVRQLMPNLIILDISMPAGGGYAVYERLKMLSGTFRIPVMIYSALARAEIEKQIQESSDTKILTKPAKPEEILAAVAALVTAA